MSLIIQYMYVTSLFRSAVDLEKPKESWKCLPVNNPIRMNEVLKLRVEAHKLYMAILPYTTDDKKTHILTWIVWKIAEKLIQLEKKLMGLSPSLKHRVFQKDGIELEAGVQDEIYTSEERQKIELAVARFEKVVFGCRFAAEHSNAPTFLPDIHSPLQIAGLGPQSLVVSMKNRETGVELIQSLLKFKHSAGLIGRVQIAMRCLVEFEKGLPKKDLPSPCKLKILPGEEYPIDMPQHVAAKVQAFVESIPVKANYIPVHLKEYEITSL